MAVHGGAWRVAFAFDPRRRAVLLVGADKDGADQKRFYKRLLLLADVRYDDHLSSLEQETKELRYGKKAG